MSTNTGNIFAGIDHDGKTYERPRDQVRLNKQTQAVFDTMKGGDWHSLSWIAEKARAPQASVSARLRDLRKEKFGGHTVNREYVAFGLWKYRLIVNDGQKTLL